MRVRAKVLLGLLVLATAQNQRAAAGLCFCWEDNAGRSDCNAAIANATDCQQYCTDRGYSRHYFQGSGTPACEGSAASGGGAGNLPVIREPDVNDADGNGDATEIVRWRYVMVVDNCEVVGDVCREQHRLFKCWCDDDHI